MELLDIIIMEEKNKKFSPFSPFKQRDKVVCKLTERPDYFNKDGHMDALLNKAYELEVAFVISDKYLLVLDHVKQRVWSLKFEDLELAPKVE